MKVYKDGVEIEVKERFLWKYLAAGWTFYQEKPKAKPGIVRAKAEIIPPEPEPIPVQEAAGIDPLPSSEEAITKENEHGL